MLSTTELFVEHIISGILSLVWIVALILCITSFDLSLLPFIKDFWGLFAVITTAIAYPIGIFVDTIADKILEPWKANLKNNGKANLTQLELIKKMNDNNVTNYFTYNRFKSRVARSSFVNFGMIAIGVSVFILKFGSMHGIMDPFKISSVIFVTFFLLSCSALYLWKEIEKTINVKLGSLSDYLNNQTNP